MPEFYNWAILLINQLDEIGEKQISVLGSRGSQNSTLMHVPLWVQIPKGCPIVSQGRSGIFWIPLVAMLGLKLYAKDRLLNINY